MGGAEGGGNLGRDEARWSGKQRRWRSAQVKRSWQEVGAAMDGARSSGKSGAVMEGEGGGLGEAGGALGYR